MFWRSFLPISPPLCALLTALQNWAPDISYLTSARASASTRGSHPVPRAPHLVSHVLAFLVGEVDAVELDALEAERARVEEVVAGLVLELGRQDGVLRSFLSICPKAPRA